MRFGRLLLASLTALAAYSYAQQVPAPRQADHFPRLLHVVVPFLAAAAESNSAVSVTHTDPQAFLALEALNQTPLSGSLILLASTTSIDLQSRRHPYQSLRC
jgi:hypothetical protein